MARIDTLNHTRAHTHTVLGRNITLKLPFDRVYQISKIIEINLSHKHSRAQKWQLQRQPMNINATTAAHSTYILRVHIAQAHTISDCECFCRDRWYLETAPVRSRYITYQRYCLVLYQTIFVTLVVVWRVCYQQRSWQTLKLWCSSVQCSGKLTF